MNECRTDFKAVTEDEVRAGTGKGWDEWFAILDEAGIAEKGHGPLTVYLQKQYSLDLTWAQAVAMRYENDRGLRSHTT